MSSSTRTLDKKEVMFSARLLSILSFRYAPWEKGRVKKLVIVYWSSNITGHPVFLFVKYVAAVAARDAKCGQGHGCWPMNPRCAWKQREAL